MRAFCFQMRVNEFIQRGQFTRHKRRNIILYFTREDGNICAQ